MTTRPVRSIIDDQLDDIEEFAGKSIRQAVELANRHGYNNPFFADICGDLCVLRFRRNPAFTQQPPSPWNETSPMTAARIGRRARPHQVPRRQRCRRHPRHQPLAHSVGRVPG